MGHFLVVEAPLLLGDATEVVGIVNLGLVEGVLLLHTGNADTVAVTDSQFDGVGACLGVHITHLGQGRVRCTIENPHGVGARLRIVIGDHLVGLLVNGDLEVHTVHRGQAVGVSPLEVFRRTGRECHSHHAEA